MKEADRLKLVELMKELKGTHQLSTVAAAKELQLSRTDAKSLYDVLVAEKKTCVSATPGKTKHFQTLVVPSREGRQPRDEVDGRHRPLHFVQHSLALAPKREILSGPIVAGFHRLEEHGHGREKHEVRNRCPHHGLRFLRLLGVRHRESFGPAVAPHEGVVLESPAQRITACTHGEAFARACSSGSKRPAHGDTVVASPASSALLPDLTSGSGFSGEAGGCSQDGLRLGGSQG